MSNIEKSYELARDMFAAYGVDTDAAIEKALNVPISIHCWQGYQGKYKKRNNSTLQ